MQKVVNITKNKYTKKTVLKAVFFFVAIAVVLIGATVLKFFVSPSINIPQNSSGFYLSAVSIVFILGALLFYFMYTRREVVTSGREFFVIGTCVTLGYIIGLYSLFASQFAVPTALTAFLLAPLVSRKRDAFIGNLFTNFLLLSTFLIGHIYSGEAGVVDHFRILDIMVIFNIGVAGGTVAAYIVSVKGGRFRQIIKAFIISLFIYAATVLYMVVFDAYRDGTGISPLIGGNILGHVAVFSVIAAFVPLLLSLLLQPAFEAGFNLVTDSRLVDLTDHNSKLIKRLRLEAPGTFSHSQQVASLAEMCAVAIGENPYLARAAAYYHDVGKLENPQYYKENQGDINLHDELMPEVSVQIIRAHTQDGISLCEKNRIPKEVSHVTVQHHGTLLIPMFFDKAASLTDEEVNKEKYSYHGVTPRTKIAAIIMLCDVAEAALRAMDKPDGEKVEKVLSNIISERISEKQFDFCDITMADLRIIKSTIIGAYGGLFHTRLAYPEAK